ncbi:MAG: alpha/beta hydrolase [Myxococcota bacterium]|nr:alpha/beta hydrolase [Myxococcota bacterium]
MSQKTIKGHRPSRTDTSSLPMLMAHASGLDASTFRPLSNVLSPRECIRIEYIGYPDGGPLPTSNILTADAETVENAIRDAGRPVHLFGHSYGGRVALEVARRRQVRLETLLVYEPVLQGALPPRDMRPFLDPPDGYAGFLRNLTDYWGGSGTWDALSKHHKSLQMRRAERVHREVWTLAEDRLTADAWASLTMPVLIMRGDYGHTDSETMCQSLADAIPGSTLTVIPKTGHMAPILDYATVGVVMKDWLGLR